MDGFRSFYFAHGENYRCNQGQMMTVTGTKQKETSRFARSSYPVK